MGCAATCCDSRPARQTRRQTDYLEVGRLADPRRERSRHERLLVRHEERAQRVKVEHQPAWQERVKSGLHGRAAQAGRTELAEQRRVDRFDVLRNRPARRHPPPERRKVEQRLTGLRSDPIEAQSGGLDPESVVPLGQTPRRALSPRRCRRAPASTAAPFRRCARRAGRAQNEHSWESPRPARARRWLAGKTSSAAYLPQSLVIIPARMI